jgi:hypothetical protein
MRIMGCDLHARQQTFGDAGHHNRRSSEENFEAREQRRARVLFKSSSDGACGNRSHGINAVVVNLMKELGSECGGDRFREHHIFGISSTNFLTTEEYACLAGRVMIRPC